METVELAYDVYETPDLRKDKYPIIFIHGFFWNKYMLKDLAIDMCHLTKRKVYCIDLRCHDQSPFHEAFTYEIVTGDIIRFMKDRNLEKVSFVCHSVSCQYAYSVLLQKPEAVEKVVMIDHPPILNYTMEIITSEVFPQFEAQNKLLKMFDPAMTLSAAKRKLRNLSDKAETEGKRKFLQKAAYELIKVNNEFKWKTDHVHLLNISRYSTTEKRREGHSDHEILIIRCKDSTLVTDEVFQDILKHNPKATLKTINDATHLLMFEKPEEFLEAVKEFLL